MSNAIPRPVVALDARGAVELQDGGSRSPHDLLDDPVYAAVCAGVEREPLSFVHPPHRHLYACQTPEHPDTAGPRAHSSSCSGCRVAVAVKTPSDPFRIWLDAGTGDYTHALAVFRHRFDELDPLRVVVERELARRGIA